jgi:hypothetical protein
MLVSGSIRARVLAIVPVSIHADRYYDVAVQSAGPHTPPLASRLRIPEHALEPIDRDPAAAARLVGAEVEIQFLMQQVTGVRVLQRPGPEADTRPRVDLGPPLAE